MEEVIDEEFLPRPSKALRGDSILEECLVDEREVESTTQSSPLWEGPPSPASPRTVRISKKRRTAPGYSAVGVSVVSMRGKVSHLDNKEIDLRLDSCADISLISLDFYESLKFTPKLRQGLKMKLYWLTEWDTVMSSYVVMLVYVPTKEGLILEMGVEAYVVPNMTVPVLLGEDFHLNYELSVSRNVEVGTVIHSFVKLKSHRPNKVRKKARKQKFGEDVWLIRAERDYHLLPHTVRNIWVEGDFGKEKEWMVEKFLLQNADKSFFAIPNTLISSMNPIIPIANPTNVPRMIRCGEVIGRMSDPSLFFDKPQDLKHLEDLLNSSAQTSLILESLQVSGSS
ncbi:hypothetical protein JAAARDRAFT_143707 [Jaapia argillacea MUCL 33604]|uniref:Uncharacterized protein n=1 Tax=Jaapia argillacea MUCL 33604 TaxID=933084 RepID=A0A067P2U6_9AGAM|nr:hypothetical protein JAAARDRAFT_143707 [Jaapia argillacea MUCL 33604]